MDSCNRFIVEGILKNLKKIHHSFADNEIIFPGFIDVHVHAREDISGKHNYKEDFESAMSAAHCGAVCAFMDMPNNPAPPLDELSWNQKYELIKSKGFENKIFPYALINKESSPLKRKVPYKLFLGSSTGQIGIESREMVVEKILKNMRGSG
jgi:dihydroorotase